MSTALDAAHVSGGQHKSKVAPDWATTAVYALQIKEQMQDEAYQSSAGQLKKQEKALLDPVDDVEERGWSSQVVLVQATCKPRSAAG